MPGCEPGGLTSNRKGRKGGAKLRKGLSDSKFREF
jgi:hypothetical protein